MKKWVSYFIFISVFTVAFVVGTMSGKENHFISDLFKDSIYTKEDVSAIEVCAGESVIEGRQISDNSEIRATLEDMSKEDRRINTLLDKYDKYSTTLLKGVVRNPETLTYALGYFDGVEKIYSEDINIDKDIKYGYKEIPLFIQWDPRWGYYPYCGSAIGITGCGPTCLSMIYVGLTGDKTMNPIKMAKYSVDNDYSVKDVGTSWELMENGAIKLGLGSAKVLIYEEHMASLLQKGQYIIASMGPGVFTSSGHFIVICGYKNGYFRILDPFSIKNSKKMWSYSEFGNQIKAAWAYYKK